MGYGDISEKCVACSGLFAGKSRAYRNFVNREYYAELQERGSPAKGIVQTPQNPLPPPIPPQQLAHPCHQLIHDKWLEQVIIFM